MSAIIQVKDLHFSYPEEKAEILKGISLDIEEGSFVAVLGRNGSGKSTLARHFNAVLLPSSGTVSVNGMLTSEEENILPIRSIVGMVFQNPDNQIVNNVVEDDVAFAPENLGVPPETIRERVDSALKTVGMYEFRRHAPHLLSGGQKQRVAIAGVLAMQPRVLVLDESTAMLDPRGRQDVLRTVETLCREKGITVVLITHHMDECIHADRLIVMSEGRVILDGPPVETFEHTAAMEAAGLAVPDTIRLAHALRKEGYSLAERLLTVEQCAAGVAACKKAD